MKLLEDMIKKYGEVRPGNVLKVDGFLNHRIDVGLVKALGEELYKHFRSDKITKILTIESSGIAIAIMTAQCFGVPMVFAKKRKTINLSDDIYTAPVHSYTNNKDYDVMVSKDYIDKSDVLLIVDDFLMNQFPDFLSGFLLIFFDEIFHNLIVSRKEAGLFKVFPRFIILIILKIQIGEV